MIGPYMNLSAWHNYRLYKQEMLIFSIKTYSALYVGNLEQGMRRNQIREVRNHHKIIKMLKLLLQ